MGQAEVPSVDLVRDYWRYKFRDPELEKQFQQAQTPSALKSYRVNFLVIGLMYGSYIMADLFIMDNTQWLLIGVISKLSVFALALLLFLNITAFKDALDGTLIVFYSVLLLAYSISTYSYVNYAILPPTISESTTGFSFMSIAASLFIFSRGRSTLIVQLLILLAYTLMVYINYWPVKLFHMFSFMAIFIAIYLSAYTSRTVQKYIRIAWFESYELDNSQKRLKEMAYRDDLSALGNRRAFTREIDTALRSAQPFCLVMLDIDDFKAINDKYGHDFGDQVIVWTGRFLQQQIRASDRAYRIGGEEFAIVLHNCLFEDGRRIALHICNTLSSAEMTHANGQLAVTASFGIVSSEEKEATDIEALYRLVDQRVYTSKRAGKNQVT